METNYKIPEINSDGLIKFYKEIWCEIWYELRSNNSVASYETDDQLLYKLFDRNGGFDPVIKARVLDGLYSTNLGYMKGYNEQDLAEILETPLGKDVVKIKHIAKDKTEKETSILSLVSKYQHWDAEVNDIENARPIYDKNVREILKKINSSKEIHNYYELKNYLDIYIAKDIKTTEKIFTIDGKKVSIYRLVDKWLWLIYKIRNKQTEIIGKNGQDLVFVFNTLFPTI